MKGWPYNVYNEKKKGRKKGAELKLFSTVQSRPYMVCWHSELQPIVVEEPYVPISYTSIMNRIFF